MQQKHFLIILLCSLFPFCAISQEHNFIHYDIKDGLAGLTVYSAVQDHHGFMWFATETGLSRFDGARFKTFTKADGLPDNEIVKLFVDSKNRIWILPFSKSICYYFEGKIYTDNNNSELARINLEGEPFGVVEDMNGNIIISENRALHIIRKDGTIQFINSFGKMGLNVISTGLYDQKIEVCATVKDKINSCFIFQIANNSLIKINNITNYLFSSRTSVLFDNSYRVFSYQKNFIKVSNRYKGEVVIIKPIHFVGVSRLSDSEFTINTVDSIFLFSIKHFKIIQKFYVGKPVNNCIKDNEGNLWFVTTGYGIYKLINKSFNNYKFISKRDPIPVYSVLKNNGSILVGTGQSSLWKINSSTNKITFIHEFNEIMQSRLISIVKSKTDKLLFGLDIGVVLFENLTSRTLFPLQSVKCISSNRNGYIVSTNQFVYNLSNPEKGIFDTLWHSRATCAYKFDSTFYIGTLAGLFLVDINKNIINAGQKEPLLNSRISGMAADEKGNVWIATYGNGIIGYRNGKVFKHITVKEGLTSNACRVISVNNGIVWAGTDKGINKIDIDGEHITSYSSIDGLNCDIINCLLVDNDTVYVGTPYGLTIFNSKEISKNSICNLIITAVLSDKNGSNTKLDNIEFAPGDKNFRIDFTAISFKSEGHIDYYYKLSGIDTKWRTTKENNIQFNALPPGDYSLMLYAVNAFGKSSGEKTIHFSIQKYFYQQNWFFILGITVIVALVWFLVNRRINSIRKAENSKLQMQQRISELEQMALRAQMNPHFIFNCLNSIQQYIFEKDALEANKFIAGFASLIRQTLDISANKYITLEQEIKYLNTYLQIEQTRFDSSFEFSVEAEKVFLQNEIFIPPLLLQPFIENSIRHGIRNLEDTKGNIAVQFKVIDKILICTIKDNGIGREAAEKLNQSGLKEYESKGLSITQRRVNEMNTFNEQRISIKTEDVIEHGKINGTLVTLQFTLG